MSDAGKDVWKRVRHSQDVCFAGNKKLGTAEQEEIRGAEI